MLSLSVFFVIISRKDNIGALCCILLKVLLKHLHFPLQLDLINYLFSMKTFAILILLVFFFWYSLCAWKPITVLGLYDLRCTVRGDKTKSLFVGLAASWGCDADYTAENKQIAGWMKKNEIAIIRFSLSLWGGESVKIFPEGDATGRAMSLLKSAVYLPFPGLTRLSWVSALLCQHQLHCELN